MHKLKKMFMYTSLNREDEKKNYAEMHVDTNKWTP
jgi:hypothetical protein